MKELKKTEEEMIVKASEILHLLDEMTTKYGAGWLNRLPNFDGSELLKDYQEKAFLIEEASKQDKITHLLYHMMSQHSFSLVDVHNTSRRDNPHNLKGAYGESIHNAENLSNDTKSYAWYSNMMWPSTYAKSESVKNHYINLSKHFIDKPLINVRRMHLLFTSLIDDKDQISALFTTLFVEYLMRIESKVIIVDNENSNELFYNFDKISDKTGYLLDFALYHNEMRDYDGIYADNYLSLFADFCFQCRRENKYEKQKVFRTNDYNIFHILRSYYISLWEKDTEDKFKGTAKVGYIDHLKQMNKYANSSKIDDLLNIYEKIKVVDLFEFIHSNKIETSLKDMINCDIFRRLYNFNSLKIKHKDTYEEYSSNNVSVEPAIVKFISERLEWVSRGDLNKMREEFDEYFSKFFLRDRPEKIYQELEELYKINVLEGHQNTEKNKEHFSSILKQFINDNKIQI